jgi:hypothetical protein
MCVLKDKLSKLKSEIFQQPLIGSHQKLHGLTLSDRTSRLAKGRRRGRREELLTMLLHQLKVRYGY